MNKDYNKEALAFLTGTDTTLSIEKAQEQKAPLWSKKGEKNGIHYICILENKNAKYTFDFWDSIRDREIIEAIDSIRPVAWEDNKSIEAEKLLKKEGIKILPALRFKKEYKEYLKKQYTPSEYEVLACLSPLYEDTLEDFCDAFGYDRDSMTAYKIFEACKEQDRMLRRLFTSEQLEKLSEIN